MTRPVARLLLAGITVAPRTRPRVRDRLENGDLTAYDGPEPAGWVVRAGQARPVDIGDEPGLALVPVDGEAALVQRVGADAETPPLVPGVRHVVAIASRTEPGDPADADPATALAEVAWLNPVGQALETASMSLPASDTRTRREVVVPDGASQAQVRIRLAAPGSVETKPRLLLEDVSFGPASV